VPRIFSDVLRVRARFEQTHGEAAPELRLDERFHIDVPATQERVGDQLEWSEVHIVLR